MLVKAGSLARIKETESFEGSAKVLREKMLNDGILVEESGVYRFTEDKLFSSPSAAAGVIMGRSINGWTSWKNVEGKTMDEVMR